MLNWIFCGFLSASTNHEGSLASSSVIINFYSLFRQKIQPVP
jgi:hypothetical protein